MKPLKVAPREINKNTVVERPALKAGTRRKSVLSLNSIHHKKTTKKSEVDVLESGDNLPKTPFTEAQFVDLWKAYTAKLEKDGERIMASIMNADVPKSEGHIVLLNFPNEMMKAEMLKIRNKVLRHFREELHNYSIDFEITVSEQTASKFAYTPQEKYAKLLEKNKALAELKKRFKLDL